MEQPVSLVLKGICIVSVFCVRCGGEGADLFLCAHCQDTMPENEALADVGFYCTVCGKQKEAASLEYQRKSVTLPPYVLCWAHYCAYSNEHEKLRQVIREGLYNRLARCSLIYSVEDCSPLREALQRCDLGGDLFLYPKEGETP